MIPNPPTPEEYAMMKMEKELHTLYKLLDVKDRAIMILCAAMPFIGIFGVIVGWAMGVSW